MDFETTSLIGSQLLQQLKNALTQYDPDYAKEAQQEAAAQIGDYYAYLETVGFKIVHYWGFTLGNRMLPMLVPGFFPDTCFAAQYAHMVSRDTDLPMRAFS